MKKTEWVPGIQEAAWFCRAITATTQFHTHIHVCICVHTGTHTYTPSPHLYTMQSDFSGSVVNQEAEDTLKTKNEDPLPIPL